MDDAKRQSSLSDLKALARTQEPSARPPGPIPALPFGLSEIDGVLPSGGLASGAVHEVYGGGSDLVHGTAAVSSLIGGILARTAGRVSWAKVGPGNLDSVTSGFSA